MRMSHPGAYIGTTMTCTINIGKRFYPSYLILITITLLVPSSLGNTENRQDLIANTDALEDITSIPQLATLFAKDTEIAERMTNVPIQICGDSSQLKYADLTAVNVNPPCEQAYEGYCGIRRNQNYTLIANFQPKVQTKSLSVQINSIDPTFGWETQLWPEFSVCSADFNITCPQNANNLVQAVLHDSVPKPIPAMRALVRVRLLGTDGSNIKRVYICRQINIQVF